MRLDRTDRAKRGKHEADLANRVCPDKNMCYAKQAKQHLPLRSLSACNAIKTKVSNAFVQRKMEKEEKENEAQEDGEKDRKEEPRRRRR